MKINKLNALTIILILILIPLILGETFSGVTPSFGGSSYRVYGSSINPQFNNPNYLYSSYFTSPEIYWPKYNTENCLERQDFILQILPGSCSPSVVTSDLLEEQNVPVFCKVSAIQVNPLIDISKIRSLRFNGNYPKGVSSISYFPAQAALRSYNQLISSPIKDNLGYVVIVISKNEIEGTMPNFIEGNITATIDYDVENAFGIGVTNFYVSELSEEEWSRDYKDYGFWNGKAYVKVESIYQNPSTTSTAGDQATISIYRDQDTKQSTITLKKGETSNDIFLSGFYCAAGMNIRLDEIKTPVETALIQVSDSTNTQQIWVARGDRILNGKCYVSDLNTYSGGGVVEINCRVKDGKFELSLTPGKATFEINSEEKQYSIGEQIKPNIFLAYAGQDSENTEFIILINDSLSESEQAFAEKETYNIIEQILKEKNSIDNLKSKIETSITNQYKKKLSSSQKIIDEKLEITILKIGEIKYETTLKNILIAKDKIITEDVSAKQNYEESIRYYEDLAELYSFEKTTDNQDDYAAQGLYEAAQLSRKFGMNAKSQELFNKLIQEYPNSKTTNAALRDKELMTRYDTSQSKAAVYINNEIYFFDLLDIKKPEKTDASATLLIDGKEHTLGLSEINTINEKTALQIKEITDDSITIEYATSKEKLFSTGIKTKKIILKEQTMIEEVSIKLLNINLNKQLKITITPKAYGPRSESTFNFKIGIEKRAIQLTPEKTEELITKTNKDIQKWSEVNNKLGDVIYGLKGACYATSAALITKNLVEGFSGASMARKKLMTSSGGWNDFCEEKVNNKEFESITKCLLENNEKINKDIEIYQNEIEKTNKEIETIQKKIGIEKTDALDFEGQVNTKKAEEEFKKVFSTFCESAQGEVTLPDKESTKKTYSEICSWETLTYEQRKEILTLYNTKLAAEESGSETLKNTVDKELGKITLNAENYWTYNQAELKAEQEATNYGLKVTRLEGEKTTLAEIHTIKSEDKLLQSNSNLKVNDKIIRIFIPTTIQKNEGYKPNSEIAGNNAIIKLVKDSNSNSYEVGEVYTIDGKSSDSITKDVKDYLSLKEVTSFKPATTDVYKNPFLNQETLKIKYFERTPYKGLPAEVPFDIENGWYVHLTYVLSGFGQPYDESGRAVNYYICNVGDNGRIEFKQSGDDICRYYNGNTAEINFPGLSASESRLLITRAQQALAEAGRQYGQKNVKIGTKTFGSAISFEGEEGKCSDFMSPQDCNLLFNVCDPVICPSSRCDLGGDFRVDNVIQTGVIGSLMLCLPNIKEGIFIPICLTGVHAGIDGYLSILNSTNACLKESLETGKNIGICDEIKSIYVCEFFWKQATPFIEVIIPRLIESLFSQGVRGGGEYLTVMSAWDNTASAIEYFKNDYAVNSMEAFTQRSTAEIGSDICKSYMSVVYPSSSNYFDSLLEADSPVQYHGWFSEDILTTATIPATSHYKVYYHIYSGNDQGAYYAIYLKDLPESNYIYSTGTYIIESGYTAKGTQIDKAKDFTAVSGYKQLCISINGKEECGFGKVSTSYFLDSVSDSFATEQATQTEIKLEKDCISGTASTKSLLQPNIQSGIEEILEPAIYNQGIIRICSTENPGKKVLPTKELDNTATIYDQWKEVGYCDDPSIKCWLDTESVKNIIQNKEIENQAINEINIGILGEENIWDETKTKTILAEAENQINLLTINQFESKTSIDSKTSKIKENLITITELGLTNQYRARATWLLGNLFQKTAETLLSYSKLPETTKPTPEIPNTNQEQSKNSDKKTTPTTTPSTESQNIFEIKNQWIYLNNEYTGYYVLSKQGGLIIVKEENEQTVGAIIDKEIKFTVQESEIPKIAELKNYEFNLNNWKLTKK